MRDVTLLAAVLLVAACAAPAPQVSKGRAPLPDTAQAAMALADMSRNVPPTNLPRPGDHGNTELAATFLELTFRMESGRALDVFSRFEQPITVALRGAVPPTAPADLSDLLARLRSEAGIAIGPADPGVDAAVTVEFVSKAQLQRLAPSAACFVVPNVGSLAEFRAAKGTAAVDWAQVTQRRRAAIFVPADTSPQEVRDCLHEEMAQAIGPLNDLYRLPDSVFNDDNFHAVLTPFDMLMLRATYAPELASGLSRAEVAARIGGIVARLNPGGDGIGGANLSDTPRAWTQAIETALGSHRSPATRRAAADRALGLAKSAGWHDSRLAFSHFALARLFITSDRDRAVAEFSRAADIYAGLPGGAAQVAHIDMQLAALALADGQPERAIRHADRAIPVVRTTRNAALLATLLLLKAEALDRIGHPEAARQLRLDSLPAARYGFGPDAEIRARRQEIAALGAQGGRG